MYIKHIYYAAKDANPGLSSHFPVLSPLKETSLEENTFYS